MDIREGRISREEGLALVEQYDGKRPESLDAFLNETDLSERDFMDILAKKVVSPWKPVRYENRPITGPHIENTKNPLEV